jgi:hypothetical protein
VNANLCRNKSKKQTTRRQNMEPVKNIYGCDNLEKNKGKEKK